jgi:hypothetical protein
MTHSITPYAGSLALRHARDTPPDDLSHVDAEKRREPTTFGTNRLLMQAPAVPVVSPDTNATRALLVVSMTPLPLCPAQLSSALEVYNPL